MWAQGDQPARCPNQVFVCTSLQRFRLVVLVVFPRWWCHVLWCHVVGCELRWSNVDAKRNGTNYDIHVLIDVTHETSSCAEKQELPSHITKYCACHEILSSRLIKKSATCFRPWRTVRAWSTMIRAWSEDLQSMNPSSRTSPFAELTFPTLATLKDFSLRLSPTFWRDGAPATKSDTPTAPNIARATKCGTATSRNIAPATKNGADDDWSLSHETSSTMFGATESPSNITKYFAPAKCKVWSKNKWVPIERRFYPTLLYSTLLFSTLLHTTLLGSSLLYNSPLFSTLLSHLIFEIP